MLAAPLISWGKIGTPRWARGRTAHQGTRAGSAPRGLPPQAAPPFTTDPSTLTGTAARVHVTEATAAARRALANRENELQRANAAINDPTTSITSRDLKARASLIEAVENAEKEVAAAGRRAILRERPTPFQDGGEPSWGTEALRRRWEAAAKDWRRLVAPDLVSRQPAPRIRENPDTGMAGASYASNYVNISRFEGTETLMHELSHLLEADERTFRRAGEFLARRHGRRSARGRGLPRQLGAARQVSRPQGARHVLPGARLHGHP